MKAGSDTRGVIAAAAMDQRGSLQKALAKERGGSVGDHEMEEFKIIGTEGLTQHASAILLDPEWGIPASKRRAKNSGLLMAYEKTGYDAATPGRLPDLLDLWSVRRINEVGADWLKVEVPVKMKYVEGTKSFAGTAAYTKQQTMAAFRKTAEVATKPFIYLSAGVSNAEFTETLELAAEAGTRFSGVLCGRATWKDGIPIYGKHGAEAFRKWLETEGVKNINNVNNRRKRAHPWNGC